MFSTYSSYSSSSSLTSNATWIIISAVLAVVGGIALYFTFLSKKNEEKFTGFLGWMYEFLNFKKLTVEVVLRITYLILAIYITLSSLASIGTSFLSFLLTLVLGNLVLRIIYEFSLILLVICRNTTEINKKLSKKDEEEK